MPNAKPQDTQAAWEIFKGSHYTASLEHVNGELERRGFGPIKDRSYAHLQKLARYGYDRYVPTNQLDVETLRDPVWDTPLRSRYLARRTDLSAVLIVLVGTDLLTVDGRIVEISELEAVVAVRGAEAEVWIAEPRRVEHKSVLLLLGTDDEARPVTVESVMPADLDKRTANVTVRFMAVIAPDRLVLGQPLESSSLSLRIDVEDSSFLLNSVRTLNVVVGALESVRIGCDEVLRQVDPDRRFYLRPPQIEVMTRENPIHLVLTMPEKVVALFIWLVRSLSRTWSEVGQGTGERAHANLENAQASVVNELARRQRIINDLLEKASSTDQATIAAVFVREIAKSVSPQGASAGPEPESEGAAQAIEVDTERLNVLVDKQIIPSIAQMNQSPVNSVETESEVEVPEDDLWIGEGTA